MVDASYNEHIISNTKLLVCCVVVITVVECLFVFWKVFIYDKITKITKLQKSRRAFQT